MSGFGIVTSILTSPAAQKIDFYLGSVHVDGEGLRKVAKLVFMKVFGGKGIGVVEEPQPVGAAASYDTKKDYFSMPPTAGFGSTPVDRYYILHEAVHAMQDAYGGTVYSTRGSVYTSELENEAVAYVAGALYSLYDTGAVYNGPIHEVAFVIAKLIKDKKGARVRSDHAAMLKAIIGVSPVYYRDGVSDSTPTFSNGV